MDTSASGGDPGGGDSAAVRHLRRRYDLLRDDYEELLDRLGTLERRLAQAPPASQQAGLVEAVQAPLLRLRDEYRGAAREIQRVLDGLETVAAGHMKPQRGPGGRPVPGDGTRAPGGPAREDREDPEQIQVDVRGKGYRQLLRFQAQVEALPGVERVAISAMDAERTTLIVELGE